MEFVDGLVVRDGKAAQQLTPEQRRRAGESIVDMLAAIHAVDLDAVGLGDLGRKEGYIARQLKRWNRQWQSSKTRELPVIDEVHDRLQAATPEQGPAAIVHGDYRLDNCMVERRRATSSRCSTGSSAPSAIRMADLGLLMVYWAESQGEQTALPGAATATGASRPARSCSTATPDKSGRDLSQIDFYVAFGYWKLACIIEGVYARYVGGAMGHGSNADAFQGFADQVQSLADAAAARRSSASDAGRLRAPRGALARPTGHARRPRGLDRRGLRGLQRDDHDPERHGHRGRSRPSTPTSCSTTAPGGPRSTSSTG